MHASCRTLTQDSAWCSWWNNNADRVIEITDKSAACWTQCCSLHSNYTPILQHLTLLAFSRLTKLHKLVWPLMVSSPTPVSEITGLIYQLCICHHCLVNGLSWHVLTKICILVLHSYNVHATLVHKSICSFLRFLNICDVFFKRLMVILPFLLSKSTNVAQSITAMMSVLFT